MTLWESDYSPDEPVDSEIDLLVNVLIAVAALPPDRRLSTDAIDNLLGVSSAPVDELARARMRRKARSGHG